MEQCGMQSTNRNGVLMQQGRVATASRPPPIAPSARIKHLAIGIVIGVVLLNLIGFSGLWLASVPKASRAITSDLAQHVAQITALMHTPDIFTEANLTQLQTELNASSTDLKKLDALLPLGGIAGSSSMMRLHHGILMANDFCQALQNLFAGILMVEPGLRAFLYSLLGAPGIVQGGATSPLTLQDINTAQRLMHSSQEAWALMQQEHQIIGVAPVPAAFGISATEINAFATYINETAGSYALAFPTV